MIYLDPPYGIKFGSNWQVSTRKRDVKDAKAEDATRQPEQIQAFRDTWELAFTPTLPYLRDRLVVARDLLTESGSIFVQIGDENVHLVRCVMDEVFGSENFVRDHTDVTKTSSATAELLAGTADFILLWYAKAQERVKYRQLYTREGLRRGRCVRLLADRNDPTGTTLPNCGSTVAPTGGEARPYRRQFHFKPSGHQVDFPVLSKDKTYQPETRILENRR